MTPLTPEAMAQAKEILRKLCEVGCCDHPDEDACPDNKQPHLFSSWSIPMSLVRGGSMTFSQHHRESRILNPA
jgi:hypothetical protein